MRRFLDVATKGLRETKAVQVHVIQSHSCVRSAHGVSLSPSKCGSMIYLPNNSTGWNPASEVKVPINWHTAEIAAQLRTMLGFHGRAGTRLAEIEWLLFRPANYGEYHGTSREHDLNQRRPLLYEHISHMSSPFRKNGPKAVSPLGRSLLLTAGGRSGLSRRFA